jgi:hypothetical protein
MLDLLGELARDGIVGSMESRREMAITFPETSEQQRKIRAPQLEGSIRNPFTAGVSAEETKTPGPFDHTDRPGGVLATDVDTVCASMARNRGACVGKTFYTAHELISVQLIRRIEVDSGRMTEISFGEKIRKDNNLMARPATAS